MAEPTRAESRLEARGVAVVRGGREILHDVSLAIEPGVVSVLVGPNGAGKSTLLRVLAGLVAPARGQVVLGNRELVQMPPRERARMVGVLFDVPDATFAFSAREIVLMGRFPYLGGGLRGFATEADLAATDRALALLELGPLADRAYPTLSSGERQRVALARLLAQAPRVFLLDEPTARLDPAHALAVARLVRGLAAAGHTVLAVVHDLDFAARLADRLWILAAGRIVATGAPGEVLVPERLAAVYGVRARRVDEGARVALVIDD